MQPTSGGGNGVCETSAQGFSKHQATGITTNDGVPQMQGVGVEEPLSPSPAIIRAQQRSLKRTLAIEIAERRHKGLPPLQVEVTKNGKIDGHVLARIYGMTRFGVLHHATSTWQL